MTDTEAIQTIREALEKAKYSTGWESVARKIKEALAALDSLAVEPSEDVKSGTCECTPCPMYPSIPLNVNSKDLEPEIQTLVQENFWGLAGKPAVEPSGEARELVHKIRIGFAEMNYCPVLVLSDTDAADLITARDKKIEDEAYQRGYNNGYAASKHDEDWSKVEANL